jgi:hypothetical protein
MVTTNMFQSNHLCALQPLQLPSHVAHLVTDPEWKLTGGSRLIATLQTSLDDVIVVLDIISNSPLIARTPFYPLGNL